MQVETQRERQLRAIRRLIGYAEVLLEHMTGTAEAEYIADAIWDGEFTMKELGGVSVRTAPVGPLVAHGPRLMAA